MATAKTEWNEALQRQIASLPNLTHLGQLNQAEVNEQLSGAYAFVNTSVYEGFPNTFIQAWLREVPVISLAVNPDDILDRASVGIHARTEQGLVDAVKRLVEDRALHDQLARNAGEHAREHHSMKNAQRLVQVIDSALASRDRALPGSARRTSRRDAMTTLLSVNNYHYYRGGAETVFLEHNRMFERQGWQVVPFAMHHARNLPSPWSEHFVDEIEFGETYSLREKLTRVPRVIYSRQARQRLRQLLDATHPDICHAHNLYHHISPSILGLLKQRGVPVVLTLHDLKIACPAYQMLASDGICERCRDGRLYNVVRHRCIKNSSALSAVVMVEAVAAPTAGLLPELRRSLRRAQPVLCQQARRMGFPGREVPARPELRRCPALRARVHAGRTVALLRSPGA